MSDQPVEQRLAPKFSLVFPEPTEDQKRLHKWMQDFVNQLILNQMKERFGGK